MAISKIQAKELIGLIEENQIPQFFEQIDEYKVKTPQINQLRQEFISGKYFFDFYERLQVFVNSIADTNFEIILPKYDIFFSFSTKNIAEAQQNVMILRKCGLSVFFSDEELKKQAGDEFGKKIEKALENSDHFLLFCTPEAMQSRWVDREYRAFHDHFYLPSDGQRRFFILEGTNFEFRLLTLFLRNIQTTTSIDDIVRILGRKTLEDYFAERRAEYQDLFELFFEDSIISEKERRHLQSKQRTLELSDEQVDEIEKLVKSEKERLAQELSERTRTMAEAEEKRLEQERLENEHLAREQAEKKARELSEKTRTMAEAQAKLAKEAEEKRKEQERLENERFTKEQAEKETKAKLDKEAEEKRLEQERIENERLAKEAEEKRKEQLRKQTLLIQQQKQSTQPTVFQKNKTFVGIGIIAVILAIFGIYQYNQNQQKQARKKQIQDSLYAIKQADSIRIADSTAKVAVLTTKRDSVYQAIAEQNRIDSINEKRKKDLPSFQEPEMVYVQGGTFQMGCDDSRDGNCKDDEKPLHSVTLSNFKIGKYEVTQAQWKAVMGKNPSNFKGDNLPVESVSWNDIQGFLRKLNQLTGKKYRLPTEAEWEYAARGGKKSGGYMYAGSNTLSSVAWNRDNSGNKTHPVGQKSPNELGIYDMSGNVWEWCSDRYGDYSASTQTNPKGANSGAYRVYRGGGWGDDAVYSRVAGRYRSYPASGGYFLGFRLVCL